MDIEITQLDKSSGQVWTEQNADAIDNNFANIQNTLKDVNIPNRTSQLLNDSDFLTSTEINDTTLQTLNEFNTNFKNIGSGLIWQEEVSTYSAIATTYPTPEISWTVKTKDDGYTYRYNGTEWELIDSNLHEGETVFLTAEKPTSDGIWFDLSDTENSVGENSVVKEVISYVDEQLSHMDQQQITQNTNIDLKANQTDLNTTNTNLANGLALKRDKATLITTNDIDKSADSKKIHLLDLAEEVQTAMAGTSSVIATVANESVTTEKYADKSVTSLKRTMLGNDVLISSAGINPPNFNTNGNIFTFYSGTRIFTGKTEYVLSNDINISVQTNTNYSLFVLYFDFTTGTFSSIYRGSISSSDLENSVLIAIIDINTYYIRMNGDYTINKRRTYRGITDENNLQVYQDGKTIPTFEVSNTDVYYNLTNPIFVRNSVWSVTYHYGINIELATIRSSLSSNVVTSPKGIESILLASGKELVYNIRTQALAIVDLWAGDADTIVLLSQVNGAILGGYLFDDKIRKTFYDNSFMDDYIVYINEFKDIYTEIPSIYDNGKMYIKATDNILVKGSGINNSYTWDTIISQIGSSYFTASPLGIINCLVLGAQDSFCFNKETLKFEKILTTAINNKHIILYANNYTNCLGGELIYIANIKTPKRLATLESYANDETNHILPSYYKDELLVTKNSIGNIYNREDIRYAVITDLHNETTTEGSYVNKEILAFVDIAKTSNLDFAVVDGDLITGTQTDVSNALERLQIMISLLSNIKVPVIISRGNHDDNLHNSGDWSAVDANRIIDRKNWNGQVCDCLCDAVHDKDYVESCYYYIDMTKKDLRIICLDAIDADTYIDENNQIPAGNCGNKYWGYNDRQVKWLAEQALGTNTYSNIIIISHMPLRGTLNAYSIEPTNGENIEAIVKAYNAKNTFSNSVTSGDFSTAKGKIHVYNFGHVHADLLKKDENLNLIYASTGSAFMEKSTLESAYTDVGFTRETNRTKGTITEALFDIFVLNKDTSILNKIRFGAGMDKSISL